MEATNTKERTQSFFNQWVAYIKANHNEIQPHSKQGRTVALRKLIHGMHAYGCSRSQVEQFKSMAMKFVVGRQGFEKSPGKENWLSRAESTFYKLLDQAYGEGTNSLSDDYLEDKGIIEWISKTIPSYVLDESSKKENMQINELIKMYDQFIQKKGSIGFPDLVVILKDFFSDEEEYRLVLKDAFKVYKSENRFDDSIKPQWDLEYMARLGMNHPNE